MYIYVYICMCADGFSGVPRISPVLGSRLAAGRDLEKMTEMPSKHRSENRPSQDRTDTRDTRKTIGPFYNRENIRRNIYIWL